MEKERRIIGIVRRPFRFKSALAIVIMGCLLLSFPTHLHIIRPSSRSLRPSQRRQAY